MYFRATFKHFPLFLLHFNLIAQIHKKPRDEKTCLLWTRSSEEGWSGFPHAEKKLISLPLILAGSSLIIKCQSPKDIITLNESYRNNPR